MRPAILLLFFFSIANAQNLVLNPGFEQTERCAFTIGQFQFTASHWSTPTISSTDLFNTCSQGEAGAPANFIGIQQPHSGNNYAGFYLYSSKNYREYVQATFVEPLEKDKEYAVSFWISLAEASDYALKEIGILLSNAKLRAAIDTPLYDSELKKSPAVTATLYPITGKLYYDDKQRWMRVRALITAKGGETNLIIGNFKGNRKTDKTLAAPKRLEISYYFIDDVSVEAVTPDADSNNSTASTAPGPKSFEGIANADTDYILKNVNFDFDKADLNATARAEIESLYRLLPMSKRPKLLISGHTDDVGSEAYNDEISNRRSASVKAYLVALGYDERLIEAVGFGEKSPLASNMSEEGRLTNRRVEFRIIGN